MLFVVKVFNLKPFHWSHRFSSLRQTGRLKSANISVDYTDGCIISKENSSVGRKNRGKVIDESRKESGTKGRFLGTPEEGKPGKE